MNLSYVVMPSFPGFFSPRVMSGTVALRPPLIRFGNREKLFVIKLLPVSIPENGRYHDMFQFGA